MLKNRKKKAFTIVELVIVIAVIAILAAVLIPTFSNIVNKANVSADTQLVRNLNTALTLDNKEHKTMQSALDAAENGGFDVGKINSKISENEILWDSVNDVFCYLNGDTIEYVPNSTTGTPLTADDYRLWKISDKVDEKYSTYLYGYDATVAGATITATKGLDVGNTEGIISVSYVSDTDQNVVIRTNSSNTTITVNAPSGIVHHYDKAASVDVIQVAMESYHEYGKVKGNINLASGNVEVENDATVSNVVIKELSYTNESNEVVKVTPTTSTVKVAVKDEGEVSTVLVDSSVSQVNVPVTGNVPTVKPGEHSDAVAYIVKTNNEIEYITEWTNSSLTNGTTVLLKDLEDAVYHVFAAADVKATFDLNGHKFKTDNSKNHTTQGELTIKDTNGAGLLYCQVDYSPSSQSYGILNVSGANAKFTLESGNIKAMAGNGTYDNNKGQYGITYGKGASVFINGGSIKAGWYCISSNGTDNEVTSYVTINGGTLTSVCDYAIYLPGLTYTIINGGFIDGAAGAISINRGTAIINGGKFSSNGTGDTGTWNDGTGNSENAIINASAKYGPVTLAINGGEFDLSGTGNTIVMGTDNLVSLSITAGTYNFDVTEYVKPGYKAVKNGNNWVVVAN